LSGACGPAWLRFSLAEMSAFTIIPFAALVGGGIWLLCGARDLIRLGLSSYRWPSTEGTITDSNDGSFTIDGIDRTGTGIVPVEYKETVHDYVYEVAGRMYRCSTYCFGGSVERAEAAYLVGTKVPVYYDPRHPEIAVLRRGLRFGAVFGVVLIGAAFLWLFFSLRG
jgi:hypothetical protein